MSLAQSSTTAAPTLFFLPRGVFFCRLRALFGPLWRQCPLLSVGGNIQSPQLVLHSDRQLAGLWVGDLWLHAYRMDPRIVRFLVTECGADLANCSICWSFTRWLILPCALLQGSASMTRTASIALAVTTDPSSARRSSPRHRSRSTHTTPRSLRRFWTLAWTLTPICQRYASDALCGFKILTPERGVSSLAR